MESIRFRCPSCSKKLSIKASRVGSTVNCPGCESSIIVPSEGLPTEKTVEELRYKLAAAEKELGKLMATELALQKAESKISSLAELEDTLTITTRKNEELRKQLSAATDGKAAASKSVEEQAAKQTALTDQVESLTKERDLLQKQLTESGDKQAVGDDKQAAEKKALAEQVETVTKEREALKKQLAEADEKQVASEAKASSKQKALAEQVEKITKERDQFKQRLVDGKKEASKSAVTEAAELTVVRGQVDEFKASQAEERKTFEDQLQISRNKLKDVEKKLQEAERLQPQLKERDQELEALREELGKAKSERDSERGKLSATVPASDYAELKAALAQSKAELDTARQQSKALVDPERLSKAETELEDLHKKLVAEQTRATRFESELESQRQLLDEERADGERTRADLENQVSSLDKEHLTTFSELETGKQLLATLKIEHENLKAEQTKTMAAAKGAQSRLDEAVRAREDVESAHATLKEKLTEAESRIEGLQAEFKQTSEVKDGQTQQVTRLKAEQQALEKRLADQARELESLRGLPDRLAEFKAKADASDTKYSQLRSTVAEYESGTARIDEERSRLTGKLDKLEQRLQVALEEKANLKTGSEELASKLRHMKGQFDEYKSTYNENNKVSENKAERERIKELAEEAREKIQHVNKRLESVLREKNQMENRLADQLERAQAIEQDRDKYRHEVKLLTERMTQKAGELQELVERFSKRGSPRELLAARKQIAVLEVQIQELSSQKR